MSKPPFSKRIIDKDEKLEILVCYEMQKSGETIAVEATCKEMAKNKAVKLVAVSSRPLEKTDSLGFFSWTIGSVIKWLKVIFQKRAVDWVYTTTYTAGVAASLIKPIAKYKICFHYHGTRLPEKEAKITQKIKYKATFLMHQHFIKNTDLIITPSDDSSRLIKKQFSAAADKKTVVAPTGVDLKVFKPISARRKRWTRKQYEIPQRAKVIMYAGLLHRRKQLKLLIQSFYQLLKKVPNSILLITHHVPTTHEEKEYKLELKRLAEDKEIDKKIIWISNPADIVKFYNISDLVVLLSKEEHFPLTMLEALACKVVFLSAPAGGVEEILSKIDPRLVVPSRNPRAVSKHLRSIFNLAEREQQEILKNGYRLSQNYSWENTAKLIYKKLTTNY